MHPLDFLGVDDGVGLDFFPAMQLPARQKLTFARRIIGALASQFRVVSVREHASIVAGQIRDRLMDSAPPSRSASTLVP
jgi:hypothetical protein